jgi:hypothetical protein
MVQAFMGGLWGFCALNYATDLFEARPSFTYAPFHRRTTGLLGCSG